MREQEELNITCGRPRFSERTLSGTLSGQGRKGVLDINVVCVDGEMMRHLEFLVSHSAIGSTKSTRRVDHMPWVVR